MIPGRENYVRATDFGGPEYIPCRLGVDFGWLYETDESKVEAIRALQSRFPDDLVNGPDPARTTPVRDDGDGVRRWNDEWQTGWEDDGHGAKTETYPLIEGYDTLSGHDLPDPLLPGRFDEADRILKQRGDRYVRAHGAHVWMHLCGNVTAILPNLIDIGLNVLNH